MTVLITLTVAGDNTGPFDLYSDADGFSTIITSGISRAQLLAGYEATVPEETTEVLLRSGGPCNSDLYLNVIGAPSTTTTTSTTSTTSSTTTLIPPTECYGYEVCADDGTGDRGELYPFNYINCNGVAVDRDLSNGRCIEICAQKDSVDSSSGAIYITEIGPCL